MNGFDEAISRYFLLTLYEEISTGRVWPQLAYEWFLKFKRWKVEHDPERVVSKRVGAPLGIR